VFIYIDYYTSFCTFRHLLLFGRQKGIWWRSKQPVMALALSKRGILGFDHGNLSYREVCTCSSAKWVPLVYNKQSSFRQQEQPNRSSDEGKVDKGETGKNRKAISLL